MVAKCRGWAVIAVSVGLALSKGGAMAAGPVGDFVVVETRRASGVAGGPTDLGAKALFGKRVEFRRVLRWLNHADCSDWSLAASSSPTPTIDDPYLSDLQLGDAVDMPLNQYWNLYCGKTKTGELLEVDGRVLVSSTPSGLNSLILEKSLGGQEIQTLQRALRARGFYGGQSSGVMDAATRRAVAVYAHDRGAAYAFARGVVTQAVYIDLIGASPIGPRRATYALLKTVYAGSTAAHFMGVEEPLTPLNEGVRELWFSFGGEGERHRFFPDGDIVDSDWNIQEVFSPDGQLVLLLQSHLGPYHVVLAKHLKEYLTGKRGPDQTVGRHPKGAAVPGVHGNARWLSNRTFEYELNCCGEPVGKVATIKIGVND